MAANHWKIKQTCYICTIIETIIKNDRYGKERDQKIFWYSSATNERFRTVRYLRRYKCDEGSIGQSYNAYRRTEELNSVLEFVKERIAQKDKFEQEWEQGLTVEDFRIQCKRKLKEMYARN